MALDIQLCRTNKGQKIMLFLGPKIWNKLSSNIKTAATAASFTQNYKNEIRDNLKEWGISFILIYYFFKYLFFYLFFDIIAFLPYVFTFIPLKGP